MLLSAHLVRMHHLLMVGGWEISHITQRSYVLAWHTGTSGAWHVCQIGRIYNCPDTPQLIP